MQFCHRTFNSFGFFKPTLKLVFSDDADCKYPRCQAKGFAPNMITLSYILF